LALPYRVRLERERERLEAARRRLIADRRRAATDIRVGTRQYIRAETLDSHQGLTRELERVQAKLDRSEPIRHLDRGRDDVDSPAALPLPDAAANTARAYRTDWREWTDWCAERRLVPLPARPNTIAAYALDLVGRRVALATVERRLTAIARVHRDAANDPPPTRDLVVQRAMAGLRRDFGPSPRRRRNRLAPDEIRNLLAATDGATLSGRRDRALLLVGLHLALRRSELVALDVADVVDLNHEPRIIVNRYGSAPTVRLLARQSEPAFCPAVALQGWVEAAGVVDGALWRRLTRWGTVGDRLSAQSVSLIIKRACFRAGLDPRRYAADSLRPSRST
jgi:integrase